MDSDFKLFAFAIFSLLGIGYVLLDGPKSKSKSPKIENQGQNQFSEAEESKVPQEEKKDN